MDYLQVASARWQELPGQATERASKAAGLAILAQQAIGGDGRVYWNDSNSHVHCVDCTADAVEKVASIPGIGQVTTADDGFPDGWQADDTPWMKIAGQWALRDIGKMLNIFPNALNQKIPYLQSPLGSMISSGMLGAGLGYGLGWIGEQMLPDDWIPGRLRRTGAVIGGLAGAMPGLGWGVANMMSGKPFGESLTTNAPFTPDAFEPEPEPPPPKTAEATSDFCRSLLWKVAAKSLEASTPNVDRTVIESTARMCKESDDWGVLPPAKINVDDFRQTLWYDNRVADQVPFQNQVVADGLVSGASRLRGGGQATALISPGDITRMAIGMGAGYNSANLVGKALGWLAGMPSASQDRLKDMGMYAGAINALIPRLLG